MNTVGRVPRIDTSRTAAPYSSPVRFAPAAVASPTNGGSSSNDISSLSIGSSNNSSCLFFGDTSSESGQQAVLTEVIRDLDAPLEELPRPPEVTPPRPPSSGQDRPPRKWKSEQRGSLKKR